MFQLKTKQINANNHQGAVATISLSLFDLETLIESVIENGKKPFFGFKFLTPVILDYHRTAECTGVNGIMFKRQALRR
jgi:23S rRNA (guanosine2251-2'-O)-methyltransferase